MDIKFSKEAFLEGQLLLIDKPLEWTSFQVVNKVRWAIRKKYGIKKIKVGHAGTLDPLATGLLIICTGKMTKKIEQFMGLDKSYIGTLRLGAITASYDLETEVTHATSINYITTELLEQKRMNFVGTIQQKPPLHSAIKKDGKRLYSIARAGETIEVPTRKVTISKFGLTNLNLPDIDFSVNCSKGTYIRSLVHDYGQVLECGAHLVSLRRTAIGSHYIENSLTLEGFLHSLEQKS